MYLTKGVQNILWKLSNIVEKIKEHLSKLKDNPYLWIGLLNVVMMARLPKLT